MGEQPMTTGQDRESYTDTQDRETYTVTAFTLGPWQDYDNVHGAHLIRAKDGRIVATVEAANNISDPNERTRTPA